MLIAFLIFVSLVAVVFLVCGITIGRTGREALRLELANLRGKHETLTGAYQEMCIIAGGAIDAAKTRHFPEYRYTKEFGDINATILFDFQSVSPTYIAPEVKNCPACFVSVRASEWPQECPACSSVFGFSEQ